MGFQVPIVGTKSARIKVSYIGLYDFDKFYRGIVNWFKSKGYFFNEKIHVELVRPTGKDHKIDFIATKEVNDYIKYEINVEIWALRTTKVSPKENLYQGEIQVRINGSMEADYRNHFEKYGQIGKALRNFYHKYIFRKRLWTKYAADIYVDTNDLINNVKSNLGLITP